MEDQDKVKDILKTLNAGSVEGDWFAAQGFHTLTVIEFSNGEFNKAEFKPNEGVPVKTFINRETGEVKIYWVKNILRDH